MPDYPLIAIIDDDDSLRTALAGLVRSLGYRTSSHASADLFLETIDGEAPHCIITDIQMPGTDGVALKQWLDIHGHATPVIMITARTEESLLARARDVGAICLLHKPFAADDLVSCIERAMSGAEAAGMS